MGNTKGNHHGIISTGNAILDLWAYCWHEAFELAEIGDHQSMVELLDFFGRECLSDLYHRGCIGWDPATVTVQMYMEVA